MLDLIITFLARLPLWRWLAALTGGAILTQLLALLLVLAVALIGRRWIQQLLQRARTRLSDSSLGPDLALVIDLLGVIQDESRPLLAWVLGRAVLGLFQANEWDANLLAWAVPFLLLWAIYRLGNRLLQWRLAPQAARLWIRQLLRPVLTAVAALHAVGLLDNLLAWGFRISESRVTLSEILVGGVVFYLFFVASRGSRLFLADRLLPQAGLDASLTQVIASFTAYAIIVAGLMLALNLIGIPLTTFTVIAGGLSVGLGFGLQELLSNFVSGFILLFERSIGPGDVVQVGDTVGRVQEVGIRSMRIRDLDNVELIVPNSRFLTDVVTNYTGRDPQVRVHVAVGVSYGASPREVEQALLEAAAHPLVLADPAPGVLFTDFGDSSLNFDLLVWTDQALQIPRLSSDLRYRIWDALAARNIEIPFPQRDIHIRSVTPPLPSLSPSS